MDDEVLERNKNLNRGFRKLRAWREAVDLYAFEKKVLGQIKGSSFKMSRAKAQRRKEGHKKILNRFAKKAHKILLLKL